VTAAEIVLDASALVRGLQRETEDATEIADRMATGSLRAHAPDLIAPETANALLRLVRAGRSTPEATATMLEAAASSALVRHPTAALSRPAFELAIATGISAYDAFYAVLSELLELPLVTADRKLADAVPNVTLVGHTRS
jgi:predicted nucleic acid-binding protein